MMKYFSLKPQKTNDSSESSLLYPLESFSFFVRTSLAVGINPGPLAFYDQK